MIPARISRSRKKLYHIGLPDEWYKGYWQDYFCWIYDENNEVIYRFDTATKSKNRGEKVMIRIRYPHAFIYELLTNYNYGQDKRETQR